MLWEKCFKGVFACSLIILTSLSVEYHYQCLFQFGVSFTRNLPKDIPEKHYPQSFPQEKCFSFGKKGADQHSHHPNVALNLMSTWSTSFSEALILVFKVFDKKSAFCGKIY